MDDQQFDTLARNIGTFVSRRRLWQALAGIAVVASAGSIEASPAEARKKRKKKKKCDCSTTDCLANGTCALLCDQDAVDRDKGAPFDIPGPCRMTADGQPVRFASRTPDPCTGQACRAVTGCPRGQACWALPCGGRCVNVWTLADGFWDDVVILEN